MKHIPLIALLLLIHCFSHAQLFKPDKNGYIADPKFHKLIKERGYQLVETFDTVPVKPVIMAALVMKDRKWVVVDWNGKEYADKKTFMKAVGMWNDETDLPDIPGDAYDSYSDEIESFVPPAEIPADRAPGSEKYRSFMRNGKMGYLSGKDTIIPTIYDQVRQVSVDKMLFFIVEDGALEGVCDNRGKLLVPVEYTTVERLSGGTPRIAYRALKNGKYGILARDGSITIPFSYMKLEWESGNTYVRYADSRKYDAPYGALDTNGNIIAPAIYKRLWQPKGARCIFVCKGPYGGNEKKGVIDLTGTMIVDTVLARYDLYAGDLYVLVRKGNGEGLDGLLDVRKGKLLLPCAYNISYHYGEQSQHVYVRKGDWDAAHTCGVMGYNGEWIVPMEYSSVTYLHREKLFVLEKDSLYGITDTLLHTVVPFVYENLWAMGYNDGWYPETYIYFRKNGKAGIMTVREKIVLPADYEEIHYFGRTLGYVRDKKSGVMDITGKPLIEEQPNRSIRTVERGIVRFRESWVIQLCMDFYGNKVEM